MTAENISYAIAPRINAAGRMDSAVTALQLVLCEDEDRAVELAHKLSDINIQRQETEMEIVKAAQELLDAEPERSKTGSSCSGAETGTPASSASWPPALWKRPDARSSWCR